MYESEIRDAFYVNPWPIVEEMLPWQRSSTPALAPAAVHRWREFRTLGGPIDLLIAWADRVLVVEFKRFAIDESAVAQCARYVGAFSFSQSIRPIGVCIGTSYSPKALYAAKGSGITIFTIDAALELTHVDLDYSKVPEEADQPLWRAVYPELYERESA